MRVYHLADQSVWYDEAFSLTASRLPFGAMVDKIVEVSWNHPPLHYFVLHVWLKLVGYGPFQARLLSAIFGTLAILMTYVLAQHLFERRTALLAASLAAVSQLGVMYSQEARPYAQHLVLVIGSIYLFLVALQERRAGTWWAFVGCATLMVYTHYYGVFVLISLLLYAIVSRQRQALRPLRLIIGGLVLALPGVLWARTGIVGHALHSHELSGPQPPWFGVHWWTFFTTINDFNAGRFTGLHAPPPLWTFPAGALLFTVSALLALAALLRKDASADRDHTALLAILCLLPLTLVIGLGLLNIQYDVRYVLFCSVPYYVLVARGITGLKRAALRRLLIVLVLAYSVAALRANYFLPYKENYRDALAYLAREYRDGDCCIFLPFNTVPLEWAVYQGEQPRLRVTDLDAVASGPASCDRIWLITYRRVAWAVQRDDEGERALTQTHSRVAEKQFFWVNVGLYARRSSETPWHDSNAG